MDPRTIANQYYDAWRLHAGDMTGVPLAENFVFSGPVASFDSADGFRAMARQAGQAVRGFQVRHQFAEGDLVCSVIDWEMAMLPGSLTAAEVLQVRDGAIVRGELIYDAEALRRAMAQVQPTRTRIAVLLDRSFRDTAEVIGSVDTTRWDAPSPCSAWTVRQVGSHLIGSVALLTRVADGEPVDPAGFDPQQLADPDRLGVEPVAAFRGVAEQSVAVFSRPDALDRRFAYPVPDAPGLLLANLCLLESLIHGWDIADGAAVSYHPDAAVVAAVQDFAGTAIGAEQRRQGLFGPACPTGSHADRLTATLGHLGRRA